MTTPSGPTISSTSPRAKLPDAVWTPAASRLAPPRSARAAPASIVSRPLAVSPPASHALRALAPFSATNRRVPRRGRQRPVDPPRGDRQMRARGVGDARRGDLRHHAARSHARRRSGVGHRLDRGIDAFDPRDMVGAGQRRVLVVKSVDVGQQHDTARARRLRDARRQPVVVAKADFLGRDAVIFVDDRHHAQAEQPVERRRGIQITPPVLQIVERHQYLRRGQPFGRQHLGPHLRQRDLAGRGRRLRILQRSAPALGQSRAAARRVRSRPTKRPRPAAPRASVRRCRRRSRPASRGAPRRRDRRAAPTRS